ncbi:MAG TPA: hypothetical protein VIH90_04715 [Candidatus Saccharimonadales bacterium]
MSTVARSIGEFPATRSVITDEGVSLLAARPDVDDLALRFCTNSIDSKALLLGNEDVGLGSNSNVWAVDGVAIKLSTVSTGRKDWKEKDFIFPANLVGQLEFLTALRRHLLDRSDGSITVPMQYFALQNQKGEFLKAEEHMVGWATLSSLAIAQGYSYEQAQALNKTVKSRLALGVGSALLRRGIDDVGTNFGEPLISENILVPENADDLASAPFCIIDQPGKGIMGRLIAGAVKLQAMVS